MNIIKSCFKIIGTTPNLLSMEDDKNSITIVDNDKHRSKLNFMLCMWFRKPIKPKAPAHTCIAASLCEGSIFYFMLSHFTYLFLSPKQTLVSTVCNHSYILTYCTCYISLCWQLSIWYTSSKVESQCWNLYLPLCYFNALLLR